MDEWILPIAAVVGLVLLVVPFLRKGRRLSTDRQERLKHVPWWKRGRTQRKWALNEREARRANIARQKTEVQAMMARQRQ